jgi:DNA-binding response OmpR family regulator
MFRVLLVLEDLSQLNAIKIFLTKLGCAVETQGVELGLKDRVVAFRPDIVLTGGTGKKVNPGNVGQKIRDIKDEIKVIILLARGMKLSLSDLTENRYDAFIESPFDPIRLIATLNKFKGKSSVDLVEKYQKLMSGTVGKMSDVHVVGNKKESKSGVKIGGNKENEAESRSVFSSKFSTSITPEARSDRYNDLTFGIVSNPVSTINKDAVKAKMTELRKDWDQDKLDQIDKEKRRFVNELFRKK